MAESTDTHINTLECHVTSVPDTKVDPMDKNKERTLFHPPLMGVASIERKPSSTRKASFRPREEVARRHDAVRALLASFDGDIALDPGEDRDVAERLMAKACVLEALEDWHAALDTLGVLRERVGWDAHAWRIYRRILRQLGRAQEVDHALEWSQSLEVGARAMLCTLARAQHQWHLGVSPEAVALCSIETHRADAKLGTAQGFIAFWQSWLLVDAHLLTRDLDAALETLTVLASNESLSTKERLATQGILAIWSDACGDGERAVDLLTEVVSSPDAPKHLRNTLAFMLFEQGRGSEILTAWPEEDVHDEAQVLSYATACDILANDPARALCAFHLLLQHDANDETSLRQHAMMLERMCDAEQDSEGLIQVLNLQLEGSLSDEERLAILMRLGALYEESEGRDHAAAEVYREALDIRPEHTEVLRALGRVYSRCGDWSLLVRLYGHEIELWGDAPLVWRKHFQVAQVYEQRLEDAQRALTHYKAVLTFRPHYLPALKSCARLMESMGHWSELADLFLDRAASTQSTRQRLYMLDKVADIAEHKLKNAHVAIGAWQEILKLCPQHPTAYAALGRLLARSQRWVELVELNTSEVACIEDEEEQADMWLRNAEIYDTKLGDLERARSCCASALALIPDYTPALECMGRLLAREGMWDEWMALGSSEYLALSDPLERLSHLVAMAQTCARQLKREDDAIRLYEEVLRQDSSLLHVHYELVRLYQRAGRWEDLANRLHRRLEFSMMNAERATVHGELAMIYEWRLGRSSEAFGHFQAALHMQPDNPHWLLGLIRTWARAGADASQLVAWLEDRLSEVEDVRLHERYIVFMARLLERAADMPEAALHLRERGDLSSFEHQSMMRLAYGVFGAREELKSLRCAHALTPWEQAVYMPHVQHGLSTQRLRDVAKHLDPTTRFWWLDELDRQSAASIPSVRGLGVDVVRLLDGHAHIQELPSSAPTAQGRRLRALEAMYAHDFGAYEAWTRRELTMIRRQDLAAHRLVEVARHVEDERKNSVLWEAAQFAFPELKEDHDEEMHTMFSSSFDGPVVEELYDELFKVRAYALLKDCLNHHIVRPRLSKIRKVYLLDMLSDLLERSMNQPEEAFAARLSAWEISGEPDHLIALVRLSSLLGRVAEALEFQREFYKTLTRTHGVSMERILHAGLECAHMLLEHSEHSEHSERYIVEAIALLEELETRSQNIVCPERTSARLLLARAHHMMGAPHIAAQMFRRALENLPLRGYLKEWKEMIRLWRDALHDSNTAYQFQWTIVRHFPEDEEALGLLVDLAEESEALDMCAIELVRLSLQLEPNAARLLKWRAAMIYDEYLCWSDDALNIYQELEQGAHDTQEVLRLKRRRAACLSNLIGRQQESLDVFREIAHEDPFDVMTFEGLASLFERMHAYDRNRIVDQIRSVLGDEVEREVLSTKHVPSRTLEESGITSMLLPSSLSKGVLDVLTAVMPLAHKVWAQKLPQRKAFEHNSKSHKELISVANLFGDTFDAFGLKRARIWFGDSNSALFEVLNDGAQIVWLNSDQMSKFDEPELRFLAGYCAALVFTDLTPLRHLEANNLWSLVEGIHWRATGEALSQGVVSASGKELAEVISSPLYAVSRRRVQQALERNFDAFLASSCFSWSESLEAFACRLGVVLCGDVSAAVRCLMKIEGLHGGLTEAAAKKWMRRDPRVRELFRFVLSESFLKARYKLGLGGRPLVLGSL